MFQPTHPGLYVQRERSVPVAPTRIDVPGFIGLAERGPLGEIRVIEGWPDFVARYGDFMDARYMPFAVRAFFENGGRRCHVLRVAAPALETVTTGAQPADGSALVLADTARVRKGALATLVQTSQSATTGPQPADRGSSIMVNVAGFVRGSTATLQQDGHPPARREIVGVEPLTQGLLWGQPLPQEFDLTQPIVVTCTVWDERLVAGVSGNTVNWTHPLDGRFDLAAPVNAGFGAGVASGFLYDESGDPLLTVEAANPGRWGNHLSVLPATRRSTAYVTRRLAAPDALDRLSLDRLDGLASGTFVEVSQEGAGAQRTLVAGLDHVARAITLRDPLVGFDAAGAADGTKPITLHRFAFSLSVYARGKLVELHENLDLPHPDHPSDSPVNSASAHLRIARLPGTDARWIDPVSPILNRGTLLLFGGRDGTAMLQASDMTGTVGVKPAGLQLFEAVAEPAALAMPDINLPDMPAVVRLPDPVTEPDPCALCQDPLPVPVPAVAALLEATPGFDPATIHYIQTVLVEHCAARGDRVAVLDPPVGSDLECLDWPDLLRWRQAFSSSFAVAYYPWIDIPDPLDRGRRALRRLPPSGHVLGQFALADREAGKAAPANRRLAWAAQLGCVMDDTAHALMNERGINALRAGGGRGLRIMGARTLSSEGNLKQLVVRRLLIRLKRAIRRDLAWAVFEPANAAFEDGVIATLEGILELEWQAGRLRGRSAEEAFVVRVDPDAMDRDNGIFAVAIAIAPALPAEFVLLRLRFTMDAMDLAELTATGGFPK